MPVRSLIGDGSHDSDIALNHGFANSKAFANAFRKKYGRLPSDFRKEKN